MVKWGRLVKEGSRRLVKRGGTSSGGVGGDAGGCEEWKIWDPRRIRTLHGERGCCLHASFQMPEYHGW